MLTPVSVAEINRRAEVVWKKIEERGITEQDIADAVKWAQEQAK